MLSWSIQITIISLILIILVHHLINFFKSTLTVPKIKDLVNTSTLKYKNMYNIIQQKSNTSLTNEDYTLIDLLPKQEGNKQEQNQSQQNKSEGPNMKNELKMFLKKQLNNDNTINTNAYGLDTMANTSLYSNY
jgi:hypothetical protein